MDKETRFQSMRKFWHRNTSRRLEIMLAWEAVGVPRATINEVSYGEWNMYKEAMASVYQEQFRG